MKNRNNYAYHNRKWLAVLLVFSMIVTLYTPTCSKAQNASLEAVPEGYIGIYDIGDLYGIRNDLSANYILMKDIDMSKDTAEGGEWNLLGHGWTPIDGFAGTLDGNGHRIIGMHIYGEMRQDVGLFGELGKVSIKTPVIRDLAMVDVDIDVDFKSGQDYSVGSLIGDGGLATIKGCYSTGNIINHSGRRTGGLGGNWLSAYDSYNACNITTVNSGYVGGICGEGWGYGGNYSSCYNIGTLKREPSDGKTYPINGSGEVNEYGGGSSAGSCYTLSGTTNSNHSGCTILFPTQLKDRRTLVGFDFDNVWEIDPYCDYPYPQLKSNRQIRIVSVDVDTEPDKTEYEQGDPLDLSGGTVKITYEDETTATLPITEDMVSGYDMKLIGEQSVTVSYCGVSTTYPITVKEVPLTGISLNKSKVSLVRNKSLQLSVNYIPANASDRTIEWVSSDPSIVKVDANGLVTAKNKGTATITAMSANGLVAQCEIEVLIPCAMITLNKTSASMKVGGTLKLKGQMLPLDTTDVLEWKTSNAEVADVFDGTVTAYTAGKAKITAYVEGGVSVNCNITVKGSSDSNKNTASNGNKYSGSNGKAKTASAITSVKAKISSIKSTGKKSIKLKLANLGNADGYQIQYSLKKNFKKSKKIKKKSSIVTIKKLKKNRRYYVRVRVYGKVNGRTYYGKWSTRKSVKTKKK